MSRIPNTFVTLQKKTKISYMIRLNSLHISRLKWRHWVLLVLLSLITLTKLIPLWGFIYTTRIYPIIGSLLSPISGLFPFAVGDFFIALSIVWGIFYPIYEIKWRKQLAKRFFFLSANRGCYP